MNTEDEPRDEAAQAQRAFERIEKAVEIFGRARFGTKPARGLAALSERGLLSDLDKRDALFSRAVCSLVLACRRRMGRATTFDEATDALAGWLEVDAADARTSMPEIFVTGDELQIFAALSAADRKRLTASLFEPTDPPWTTMAPRVLHRAIALALRAPILRGAPGRFAGFPQGSDAMPSTFSAAVHVVEAAFESSLYEPLAGAAPPSLFVIDPRCCTGTLLLATLEVLRRALSSREQDPSLVEATLRSFVRNRLRGFDDRRVAVSLARLGLWLDTGQALTNDELSRAVVRTAAADEEFRKRPEGVRVFVFSEALEYGARWPFERVLTEAEEGETVGMLIDRGMAAQYYGRARAEWDREFFTVRPLVEPRLRSPLERPRTLAVVARRRADATRTVGAWANRPYGVDPRDGRLLASLSVEPCVALVAETLALDRLIARPPSPDWPCVAVLRNTPLLEAVLVRDRSPSDSFELTTWAPPWDAFTLFALLRSTVVRWQRAMLSSARGGGQTHTVADVMELAVPSSCDIATLRAAGERLAAARTELAIRAAIEVIDAAVEKGRAFDAETSRRLRAWRDDQPLPTMLVAGELPVPLVVRDYRPSSDEAPQRPAPTTPARGVVRPTETSAHNEGAPSVRPTKSNGVLGQGSESMLRNRADDGRSAVIPGRKRVTAQPEGDAEREAWAILRAAGSDGLTLGALVRRAREHDED
ncbi:MAG: hypothetical protein JNK05_15520, partial [Myxococcales bacterium]|nr:hypothetical protein [Myxococcales bacterium]